MVAIEPHSPLSQEGFTRWRLPFWAVIAVTAALISMAGFVGRGFSDNGLRLGSELAWRFTCFMYFAAVIAGPLSRLIPSESLRFICEERRQLMWGFCASFGVYLAGLLIPNLLMPAGLNRDGLTAGMSIYALFGAALTSVIAYTTDRRAARLLGEEVRGVLLGVGLATFWLVYALTGLARISGPHRPDAFYGFSLSLMIVALLLRFADRFAAKIRASGNTV